MKKREKLLSDRQGDRIEPWLPDPSRRRDNRVRP